MNPSLLIRAWRRHSYMQDLPAYREFLEEVRAAGATWLVPQDEIARWWESRQAARLELSRDGGRVHVGCALARSCVEVDGARVEVLPFELPAQGADGPVSLPAWDERLDSPFFRELIGHLGYGHVTVARDLAPDAALSAESLSPVLERLRETAIQHQRFDVADLDHLRDAFRAAHHARGLPDLRLWTLPAVDGSPARAAVSSRYDVDKAIVNMPQIQDLEESFGLRSSVYLRPMGMFYGRPEIQRYLGRVRDHEIALHGEFISTAEERFGDEFAAARGEKQYLEELTGREVAGVCMHGGELRTNTSPRTREAVEQAGFRYETMYRNRYYLPLHLPHEGGVRRTLSIGQHYADITVPGDRDFATNLTRAFVDRYREARSVGGVFVPVMHPLYFNVRHYAVQPRSMIRIAAFMPKFLGRVIRMKSGQHYSNEM